MENNHTVDKVPVKEPIESSKLLFNIRNAPYAGYSGWEQLVKSGFSDGGFQTDFTITAGEKSFSTHSMILRSTEYFRVMLDGPWKEASDRVVSFPNDDPVMIEMVLGSIYGAEYDRILSTRPEEPLHKPTGLEWNYLHGVSTVEKLLVHVGSQTIRLKNVPAADLAMPSHYFQQDAAVDDIHWLALKTHRLRYSPSSAVASIICNGLMSDIAFYVAADKFGVKKLKEAADNNARKILPDCWNSARVLECAQELFKATPNFQPGSLAYHFAEEIGKRADMFDQISLFKELIANNQEFAQIVLLSILENKGLNKSGSKKKYCGVYGCRRNVKSVNIGRAMQQRCSLCGSHHLREAITLVDAEDEDTHANGWKEVIMGEAKPASAADGW